MNPINPKIILYEINTWVWLTDLSAKYQQPIRLGNVPDVEWQRLAAMGINAIWLMGVWTRSPAAVALTFANPYALREFKEMLPDFTPEDLVGSAYSIQNYSVDPHLGGPEGLAAERRKLAELGIRLILDYVPNHVAPDHAWAFEHPEYFVHGNHDDLERDPDSFMQVGDRIYARGRDPNFPAWQDTLQLNAFSPALRTASVATLDSILAQCDGVRVDMAMLFINRIFAQTWKERIAERPVDEFWPVVITSVRAAHPSALFIAEAYWGTEPELLTMGFDACYDKSLYDALRDRKPTILTRLMPVHAQIHQSRVRFIENHDEKRAVSAFAKGYWRAAAIFTATLPGMTMFHDGQFEGRKKRISVLLGRRAVEHADPSAEQFYAKLLEVIRHPTIQTGVCKSLPVYTPRGRRQTRCQAWMWTRLGEAFLIFANASRFPATCHIKTELLPSIRLSCVLDSLKDNTSSFGEIRATDQKGQIEVFLKAGQAIIYKST